MIRSARASAAAVLAAVVLAACGGGGSDTPVEPVGVLGTLAPGDPLAAVALPVLAVAGDPAFGEVVDMGSLTAPSVVNFWATWCSFCVDEMPDIEAVHAELGDQVRFIGVDREDFAERAITFATELGVTYEMVQDLDGSFFRSAKARGMPTTLFVNAEGIILHRHAGPMSADKLRQLIAEFLDIGST